MNKIKIYALLFLILGAVVQMQAQQERKHIRRGNRDYKKAIIDSVTVDTVRYEKAEQDYRKALEKDPNNWDAMYNVANSLYKQGKYEDAIRQFQAVAGMEQANKDKRAMAYHNLGNSYLFNNKIDEAIEAYKNSLRNNPKDLESKYNLAWAQHKKGQQPPQQQQQKDQDQDKNKDKENEDKQDQQQQQNEDKKQQQQKEQQQQANPEKISKEDAKRILEALQNDEKDVQEKVQKQKAQPRSNKSEKDW